MATMERTAEKRIYRWAALLMAAAMAGCASGREASGVSRTLLARTIAYEGRIDGRISDERIIANVRLENLRGALAKEQAAAEEAIASRAVGSFRAKIEGTDRGIRDIDVRDFVEDLFRSVEASRDRYSKVLAEYDAYQRSLGELEARKQSIIKVRRGLEYLAAEPSEGQRLSEWFDFVSGVVKKADLKAAK
jgi:hypothetical protein